MTRRRPASSRCRPAPPLDLTSSRIYETGVKQLLWDGKAEWTLSVYDLARRNVYVAINDTTSTLAGEIRTKGVEFAAAVRPVENVKLWGNVAFTAAHYSNFFFNGVSADGNTPSNVAPVIINAGASYRFNNWRWPVEFGGSVRHVGNRYLYEDDPHDHAGLYHGGRLCVRRYTRPGSAVAGASDDARNLQGS